MTDPTTPPTAKHGLVAGWLRHLIDPDQVVELRALGCPNPAGGKPLTLSGYFRGGELADLVAEAGALSAGGAAGVYFTLNPVKPARFVTQFPRVRPVEKPKDATADADILCRRWLFVDIDPVRAAGYAGQAATDGEKLAAFDLVCAIGKDLRDRWGARQYAFDSGNGYHLFYRLAEDQPVGPLPTPADHPMRAVLRSLAAQFDTPHAKIDQGVYNPARIVKVPGTVARKGAATVDRPHRRARMLSAPADGGGS